jgi:dolichol-phosphate mannosyltransferase
MSTVDKSIPVVSSKQMPSRANAPESLKNQQIFVVLPAYNEGQALLNLLHRLDETMIESGLNYSVIVVDDGSSDETADSLASLAEKFPLQAYRNPQNMGLGRTLKRGLEIALAQAEPDDIIVTMDGDDTHPPATIPEMMFLINGGFDVVIASRFRDGASIDGLSSFRESLSGFGRFLFIGLMPIKGVRDFTCGFRAFRASALQQAARDFGTRFMTETGFTVTADLLLRLRGRGLRFVEVPLHLAYQNKTSPSKMKVVKTTLQTFKLLLKRRLGY